MLSFNAYFSRTCETLACVSQDKSFETRKREADCIYTVEGNGRSCREREFYARWKSPCNTVMWTMRSVIRRFSARAIIVCPFFLYTYYSSLILAFLSIVATWRESVISNEFLEKNFSLCSQRLTKKNIDIQFYTYFHISNNNYKFYQFVS